MELFILKTRAASEHVFDDVGGVFDSEQKALEAWETINPHDSSDYEIQKVTLNQTL